MREPKPKPAPSVVDCLFTLLGVRLSLLTIGFMRTLRWVERGPTALPDPPSATSITSRAARTIAVAAAILPGRFRCLEQSLALHAVLRRRGIVSHLRLGVQPYGMLAHAWVEYRGEPINEVGELLRKVVPFPEIVK